MKASWYDTVYGNSGNKFHHYYNILNAVSLSIYVQSRGPREDHAERQKGRIGHDRT